MRIASDTPPSRSHNLLQVLPICDEVFKHLENYEGMTVEYLSLTKIGKVMRHIESKGGIPRQEEFRFQERAKTLVEQWSRFLTVVTGDKAKGSDSKESRSVDVDSPVLRDMITARRWHIGNVGGLKKVIVENAAGRPTLVTLPYLNQ